MSCGKDTEMTDKNIREELLRRPTDRRNIREIKLQENGLLARLVLQLGDRLVRLLSIARREVNLRVVHQKLLEVRWLRQLTSVVKKGEAHLDSFLSDASIATYGLEHTAHTCLFENAPVTRMTLPVRSGMSSTPQVGFGGKDWSKTDSVAPMCSPEYGRDDGKEERGSKK
jgi:hypothetical protein